MTEPVKCRCGRKAKLQDSAITGTFYVICKRESVMCWIGPDRKTKAGATKAWNKLMEVK